MDLIHCKLSITDNGKGRVIVHMTKDGVTFFSDTSLKDLQRIVDTHKERALCMKDS